MIDSSRTISAGTIVVAHTLEKQVKPIATAPTDSDLLFSHEVRNIGKDQTRQHDVENRIPIPYAPLRTL